jgi:hypothetical protein
VTYRTRGCRDDNQRTALHWAAASGHAELCTFLLSASAEEALKRQALISEQAATLAARVHDPETDLNDGDAKQEEGVGGLTDDAQETPRLLEQLRPLLDAVDDRGDTAVHVAARLACCASLPPLLSAALRHEGEAAQPSWKDIGAGGAGKLSNCGARVPLLLLRNRLGHTPLHCAVLADSATAVRMLLYANPAAAAVTDKAGLTPMELALRRRAVAAAGALAEGEGKAAPATKQLPRAPTLVVTSPDCLQHHTCEPPIVRGLSDAPPENIQRLHTLVGPTHGILRGSLFSGCAWAEDCHPAAMTDVLRVHDWGYLRKLKDACAGLAGDDTVVHNLDADTAISRGSFRAALKAAGAVCHAIDEVMAGQVHFKLHTPFPPVQQRVRQGRLPSHGMPYHGDTRSRVLLSCHEVSGVLQRRTQAKCQRDYPSTIQVVC